MLKLTKVLGNVAEPALANQLHHLAHHGGVEYITLSDEDTARRRFRALTDRGADCVVILSRSERLQNGAVLLLETDRAVVVRLAAPRFLGIRPRDEAAALELGYMAGNMHWKVRFKDSILFVQLDGDRDAYLARIASLLALRRVEVIESGVDDGSVARPEGAAVTRRSAATIG
jgi:urease accessory protein